LVQALAALPSATRTFSVLFVMLSNYHDPDLIKRGLQLGAIDYLIKTHITPAGVSGSIARWTAAQPAWTPLIAMEYDRTSAVRGPSAHAESGEVVTGSGRPVVEPAHLERSVNRPVMHSRQDFS